MTSAVEHLSEHGVIQATHTGVVSPAELLEAGEKGFAMARELDLWLFLSDCTGLTDAPQIVDQLGLAQVLQAMGVSDRYRQALVRPVDPVAADTVATWETVSVNRGISVRVMADRDEGLRWLLAD